MTVRGHVRSGSVVLDEPLNVPDGTPVEVSAVDTPSSAPRPTPGSSEAMRLLGEVSWAGDLDELRRLQSEVQRMREEDLREFGDCYDRSPLDKE